VRNERMLVYVFVFVISIIIIMRNVMVVDSVSNHTPPHTYPRKESVNEQKLEEGVTPAVEYQSDY
jgi:hypothetical protein